MLGKFAASFVFALGIALLPVAPASAASSQETQRAEVRKTSQNVLKQLYRIHPSAKGTVASAAGYAVFSNFGMKIFVAGGGGGSGMAVNNATKNETFMKMVEVQAGLGFGIKKFRVIFIFETEEALNQFINSGWEFGGQATAESPGRPTRGPRGEPRADPAALGPPVRWSVSSGARRGCPGRRAVASRHPGVMRRGVSRR